jgi:sortase A
MFGYPLATDLYAQRMVQQPLIEQFGDPGLREAFEQDAVPSGRPVTRLEIPSIGVNAIVVEGTTPRALRAGAGHYPSTPLPGEDGNVAIAGHRTTFGAPFRDIDAIRPGAPIVFELPYGTFRYVVFAREIVLEDDWTILRRRPFETLVLTACHPLYGSSHRWVVYARLTAPS